MSVFQVVTILLLVLGFFNMGWNSRTFFTRPSGSVFGIRVIEVLSITGGAAQLAVAVWDYGAGWLSFAVGCVLFLASNFVFYTAKWANAARPLSFAFSPDVPQHLVTTGPYKFIRHPFYTSYLLHWVAAPIATAQPILFIPFVIMLAVYTKAALLEERKFEGSPLQEQYRKYRYGTGFFLPYL